MKNFDDLFVQTSWRIMESLHDASSTAEGLNACLDALCDALESPQGSVWLTLENGEKLYELAEIGGGVSDISLGMGEGITGRVVNAGKTEIHVLEDIQDLLAPEERGAEFPEGYLLWVPLCIGKNNLGCLQFGGRGANRYSEAEQKLCERCASIIALDLMDKGIDFVPEKNKKVLVSIRGVCKDFMTAGTPVRILKNVNLDIYEGELVVILGESGSGKSTLLNLLGGMDSPTEGRLLVEGEDFSNPTEREMTLHRRNRVGFIFQSYNLMPNLTSEENVAFTAEISKAPMDPAEALAMVGLKQRANYYPSSLSGGQQQRVAIARAIAKSPRLILADEPTAALDYQTSREVLDVLQTVVRERGTTLVMVTHNAEIARMADRIIRVKDGRIHNIRANPIPLSAFELNW